MKKQLEKDKKFIKLQNYYLENRTEVVPQCSKTMPEENVQNCSRMTMCQDGVPKDGEEPEFKLFCSAYIWPGKKWDKKDCPLADEFLKAPVQEKEEEKKRAGQQKQKKKARR